MPLPKLTKRAVDAARPHQHEQDYFVWDAGDGAVKGFGLRVWPRGRKQFVFQYRDLTRRTWRLAIGDYGPWTADRARERAEVLRGQANEGRTDPARYPHAQRAAQRAEATAPTVAALAELFLTNRRKRVKPSTVAEYRRLLDRDILPTLGDSRVNNVSRRDIERLLASMEARPAVANNVHVVLRAMFTYAIDHELRADGKNPCARIRRYPVKSRKKSLTQPQYTALGAALARAETKGLPVPPSLKNANRGESKIRLAKRTGRKRGPYKVPAEHVRLERANPIAVAVLRFLALSGWREGEALSLRRDVLDWDRGVAILQDTKTGRSVRPLGVAALDVLREGEAFAGNPYVFPGSKPGDHLKEAKRLWLAAKHAAGLKVRLHDLRHSFTTVGRELGYSDYVIARLVGHVVEGMTGRYGDVPDEIVKQAADAIASTIARRLAGENAKVLSLVDRAATA
ncbi:MAG: tyrosine-type recombinase/integrase [Gemmatimonadaceae bacterium]